MNIYTVVVD